MNKNVFLGLDKSGKYCCLLKTLASMEMIKNNLAELDESDFVHDSTNWSGCDETERTLEIKNLEIVGKPLFYRTRLFFQGMITIMGMSINGNLLLQKYVRQTEEGSLL